MNSKMSYTDQWKEYDRRANLIAWLLLSIIPAIGVIGLPLSYWLDSATPALIIVFLWWIAVLFSLVIEIIGNVRVVAKHTFGNGRIVIPLQVNVFTVAYRNMRKKIQV